ncbi:1,2-dihydroxy-3-keto-5-methylthiopentene dioxygenase-like [Ixodes scapularis]|uniref:1,2-dihydroxy-3-keto-5-methylthiopentene dioxygenase-like n=1 Tax=Ixodes scapularis TaxID=6945 RepID=UPI001A9F3950|nr:1,2-dihydroxy-3-keto-5-methylthiopentene dioxygenase-like [Ixodes scapularis]
METANEKGSAVRAWYLDEAEKMLTVEELRDQLGVSYYRATSRADGEARLAAVMKEKGCHEIDITPMDPFKPDSPIVVGKPIKEHRHPEEEVRFMSEGTAFFDIRDYQDKWVRIQFNEGDILVLPPNAYHRFMINGKVALSRVYPTGQAYSAEHREI